MSGVSLDVERPKLILGDGFKVGLVFFVYETMILNEWGFFKFGENEAYIRG
jgi:hypothetical protein